MKLAGKVRLSCARLWGIGADDLNFVRQLERFSYHRCAKINPGVWDFVDQRSNRLHDAILLSLDQNSQRTGQPQTKS